MSLVVNAEGKTLPTISQQIKENLPQGEVRIQNATHLHGLCGGLKTGKIAIEGDSGDYLGVVNDGATLHVEGNAGDYLADNMTSGCVIVEGDAGVGAGAYCYGGTLVVRGNVGDFTAVMNKGATIVVQGNVGDEVATYMLAGDLVIVGNAGRNLGNYLIRGNIYISGEWESLGHNTLVAPLTPEDVAKLQGYLSAYGIQGDASAFQKIGRLSEKPFYKSKAAAPALARG